MSSTEPDPTMAPSSSPPTPSSSFRLKRWRHTPDQTAEDMSQLRRSTTLNVSISRATTAIGERRPFLHPYIGRSNAIRLHKRATLCKMENDEPIFGFFDESARAYQIERDALPFDESFQNDSGGNDSNTLGYSVQCYATHAEDEQKRKEAEIVKRERQAMISSINSSRRVEGAIPLVISPSLTQSAQAYADKTRTTGTGDIGEAHEMVEALVAGDGSRIARLESPKGMGALAAAEMWYGGKYRRHLFGVMDVHPTDCLCRLRLAFETLVDPAWKGIGVGWSEEGRWIVELGELCE